MTGDSLGISPRKVLKNEAIQSKIIKHCCTFNFNRLFTPPASVAIIFGLLNGIIGFNLCLFAVTTAITTHHNEGEREGFDCECVFEHKHVAFAPKIALTNGLIGYVCGTPHGAGFATITFGFKGNVIGSNNDFNVVLIVLY